MSDPRELARELAAEAMERGKPLEWFDALYQRANGDPSFIPWADRKTNPNLSEWLSAQPQVREGTSALVVGCGLGDDAEALAAAGYNVTAFDLSEHCIEWCKQRHPDSPVVYSAANLLHPPKHWHRAFDFVLECYTLQAMPDDLRAKAIEQVVDLVAPGGTLLVIARGRDETDPTESLPFPLTKRELHRIVDLGLTEVRFDDYFDKEEPDIRRFRIEYRRPIESA